MKRDASSRKKKSPDDEKLSKRIAAELKVQQEANKKRNRQSGTFDNEATERSALPIVMQTRDVGPTFVTSPKSVKSAKSAGTVAHIVENPTNFIHNFGNTSNGCLVSCFIFGSIYIAAYIYYYIVSKKWQLDANSEPSSMNSIKWIAITSVGMVLIVPFWFALKDRFNFALLGFISLLACSVSLLVHLVYYIIIDRQPDKTVDPSQPKYYLSPRNPLNFWLSIAYLLMTLIAISIMIRQLLNLVSRQIEGNQQHTANSRETENGHGPGLSQYMAPS